MTYECDLCGESFDSTQPKYSKLYHFCKECYRTFAKPTEVYLDAERRRNFRAVYKATGIRTTAIKAIELPGPAESCPKDCKWLGKCGSDCCCDYMLKTGKAKYPKDGKPGDGTCNLYEPKVKKTESGKAQWWANEFLKV